MFPAPVKNIRNEVVFPQNRYRASGCLLRSVLLHNSARNCVSDIVANKKPFGLAKLTIWMRFPTIKQAVSQPMLLCFPTAKYEEKLLS